MRHLRLHQLDHGACPRAQEKKKRQGHQPGRIRHAGRVRRQAPAARWRARRWSSMSSSTMRLRAAQIGQRQADVAKQAERKGAAEQRAADEAHQDQRKRAGQRMQRRDPASGDRPIALGPMQVPVRKAGRRCRSAGRCPMPSCPSAPGRARSSGSHAGRPACRRARAARRAAHSSTTDGYGARRSDRGSAVLRGEFGQDLGFRQPAGRGGDGRAGACAARVLGRGEDIEVVVAVAGVGEASRESVHAARRPFPAPSGCGCRRCRWRCRRSSRCPATASATD